MSHRSKSDWIVAATLIAWGVGCAAEVVGSETEVVALRTSEIAENVALVPVEAQATDVGSCDFDWVPAVGGRRCDGRTRSFAFLECPRNDAGELEPVIVSAESEAEARAACSRYMYSNHNDEPLRGEEQYAASCPRCPEGSSGCALSLQPVGRGFVALDRDGEWSCGCIEDELVRETGYVAVPYVCGKCRSDDCPSDPLRVR